MDTIFFEGKYGYNYYVTSIYISRKKKNKYLYSKTLAQVSAQPNDSPFLNALMRINVALFNRGIFIIGDGTPVGFGRIFRRYASSLMVPTLYNIVQCKKASASAILGSVPLNIPFMQLEKEGMRGCI